MKDGERDKATVSRHLFVCLYALLGLPNKSTLRHRIIAIARPPYASKNSSTDTPGTKAFLLPSRFIWFAPMNLDRRTHFCLDGKAPHLGSEFIWFAQMNFAVGLSGLKTSPTIATIHLLETDEP